LVTRESIRPPKFADKFALLDFESEPMPAISLFPVPSSETDDALTLSVCGLDCKPQDVALSVLEDVPEITVTAPLVCQIFNWSEVVEWTGYRFVDVARHLGIEVGDMDYVAFYSRDGHYFEGLPAAMALDERVLLATRLNGQPLRPEFGGPLRLVVPFLQGYKSVKWLASIRVTRHDPIGIKRLLGQSKTGHLGLAWRNTYGIEPPAGTPDTPV
jgi:DMSO/TMAO reductase YedYZ molybdopterin-dependent catalytic subunit